MGVFMFGLKTEPAMIGSVVPGKPAATAVAVNRMPLALPEPGADARGHGPEHRR